MAPCFRQRRLGNEYYWDNWEKYLLFSLEREGYTPVDLQEFIEKAKREALETKKLGPAPAARPEELSVETDNSERSRLGEVTFRQVYYGEFGTEEEPCR